MISEEQIPLGNRIPDKLHAVSVSLPTMEEVIGYEERDPAILARMNSGYPRFVKHECLRQIESFWQEFFDKPNEPIWLTASEEIAHLLESHLNCPESKFLKHQGVSGVRIPIDEALNREAKLFLQHIGGYLCSRKAEDYLVANELQKSAQAESLFEEDAEAKIISVLQPLLGGEASKEILLANSGMNAIYATFQAVNQIQAPKGRHSWIRLGWLYADTMHILDKLSHGGSSNKDLHDVFDLDQLETLLAKNPDSFAGIITETPTNPLIQSMDIERIRELATAYGVYLVLDPTVLSPANVDASPYADIIVNSLTKYAANEGDVIMGAVSVMNHCPENESICENVSKFANYPYERNRQRLAQQIDGYLPLVEQVNESTLQVVEYLNRHTKVSRVHWANEPKSQSNFQKIARSEYAIGGMVSFELESDLARFYDRLTLCKGPSFGMKHSLACPFMYLAHYELVSTSQGRKQLAQAGINPELIRFSVGAEPVAAIIDSLRFALS
jgi:cystathionine gamma-synthase